MRYMWACRPGLTQAAAVEILALSDIKSVTRVLHQKRDIHWVFITNYADFQFALVINLVDADFDYWSITSCNKQYVTNEVTGKYVGALSEVSLTEAEVWLDADDKNWFVCSKYGRQTWMPVKRNPNRLIPTDTKNTCVHCGNTNAQTPGNRYRPVYRPWPLHADA